VKVFDPMTIGAAIAAFTPEVAGAVIAGGTALVTSTVFTFKAIGTRRSKKAIRMELARRLNNLRTLLDDSRHQYEAASTLAQQIRNKFQSLNDIEKVESSKEWSSAHYRLIAKLNAFEGDLDSIKTYLLSDMTRNSMNQNTFAALTELITLDIINLDEIRSLTPFSKFDFTGWHLVINKIEDAKILLKAK